MSRSQNSFIKKQKEKKKQKKKEEKQERKEIRRENARNGTLDEMMAYVDEYGNILDSPPEEPKKKKEDTDESDA